MKSQKYKKRGRKQKKRVSSVKLGRNKDEGTFSEEHYVQEDYTADLFFEDIIDKDAAVTHDLERKSDETEEINVEEKEASDVKSGNTEELDLERTQSPSSPIQEEEAEEVFNDEELLADILLQISRPRALSIPGHSQPQQPQVSQPTQATDPKDKALETANDEEVARKIQAEWDVEVERKRLEDLKKPKILLKKPQTLA
ncbi:hypothetical protein Tco_0431491 [Tanacetum coccineum]